MKAQTLEVDDIKWQIREYEDGVRVYVYDKATQKYYSIESLQTECPDEYGIALVVDTSKLVLGNKPRITKLPHPNQTEKVTKGG